MKQSLYFICITNIKICRYLKIYSCLQKRCVFIDILRKFDWPLTCSPILTLLVRIALGNHFACSPHEAGLGLLQAGVNILPEFQSWGAHLNFQNRNNSVCWTHLQLSSISSVFRKMTFLSQKAPGWFLGSSDIYKQGLLKEFFKIMQKDPSQMRFTFCTLYSKSKKIKSFSL